MESESLTLQKRVVPILSFVSDCLETFHDQFEERNIALSFQTDVSSPSTEAAAESAVPS